VGAAAAGAVAVTAGDSAGEYDAGMVAAMEAVIDGVVEHAVAVTFPLRAEYVPGSWPVLSALLRHPLTTVTLWAHERPDVAALTWLRDSMDLGRTMWDLPPVTSRWGLDERGWARVAVAGMVALVWAVGLGVTGGGGMGMGRGRGRGL